MTDIRKDHTTKRNNTHWEFNGEFLLRRTYRSDNFLKFGRLAIIVPMRWTYDVCEV